MRDDIAISVQNVSKKFGLFRSPADRLLQGLRLRRKRGNTDFWALRDVTFDVPRGTTVGILGRNGSGKSTLLQIIYSVLQPTSGSARCRGTTSALLELGAGFNPAFTGRDNIWLHGATRGLSRREIQERLPRIEAFAEIGPFLDQPVKNYSSGMFVRLAFAAAVSDDPDIFIVDEALAVGDAKFQHKCYQKFLDFQRAGKTVLLVTHDTQAVIKHCQHALLLENGRLLASGEPKEIANRYFELLFTGTVNGYRAVPQRVRQGYKGFSIVHYGNKFFGLSERLGPFDVAQASEAELGRLTREGLGVVADSLSAAKLLVDRLAWSGHHGQPEGRLASEDVPGAEGRDLPQSRLEQFLAAPPDPAGCSRRPTYNKNEHRFGDRRAELVDYLVLGADGHEAAAVLSGEQVDLYFKVCFGAAIEQPQAGIALKTVDGLLVYGINTRMKQVRAAPVQAGDVLVFKFTVRLALASGDAFVDFGVVEDLAAEHRPIDVRYDLIHLQIQESQPFSGLADLGADIQEVFRAGAALSQGDRLGA